MQQLKKNYSQAITDKKNKVLRISKERIIANKVFEELSLLISLSIQLFNFNSTME
jgi:hypothetical protein